MLLINRYINSLRKAMENKIYKENNLESSHNLEYNLAMMKKYRQQLRAKIQQLQKIGAGLSCKGKRYVMWKETESCFSKKICTGFIVNLSVKDPREFFEKGFEIIERKNEEHLKKCGQLKVNSKFTGLFIKPTSDETYIKWFNTKYAIVDTNTNLSDWYWKNICSVVLNDLEEFHERDSGWALVEIRNLKLNFNRCDPLECGISTYGKRPKFLQVKKGKSSNVHAQSAEAYAVGQKYTAEILSKPTEVSKSREVDENQKRESSATEYGYISNYQRRHSMVSPCI